MDTTPRNGVLTPEMLAVITRAVQSAREKRPQIPVEQICQRIVTAAESGVSSLEELTRAGIGDE